MSQLKALLEAPENKNALKALDIIENFNSDPAELHTLLPLLSNAKLKNGKARTNYLTKNLLAACYNFHELHATVVEEENCNVATIGPDTRTPEEKTIAHKLACFKILSEAGLNGDENNWRGNLGRHIVSNGINKPEPWNLEFAIQWEKTRPLRGESTNHAYLANTYDWIGNPERLDRAFALGLDPKNPQLLMTCLRYYGCASNSQELVNGKLLVIRKLLDAGNSPDPEQLAEFILRGNISDLYKSTKDGVIDLVAESCVIPWYSTIPEVSSEQVLAAVEERNKHMNKVRQEQETGVPTATQYELMHKASNHTLQMSQALVSKRIADQKTLKNQTVASE